MVIEAKVLEAVRPCCSIHARVAARFIVVAGEHVHIQLFVLVERRHAVERIDVDKLESLSGAVAPERSWPRTRGTASAASRPL
jgi:hypothetical protein